MAPCECGDQFRDLTEWKEHSLFTGHCCIYKCRKVASAASIPGLASEIATSSAFIDYHSSPWNALPPSDYQSLNSPPASFETATSSALPFMGYYPSLWNALPPSDYQSLNSPPALELETYPFAPSFTASATTTALNPSQAPPAAPSEPPSATSFAPTGSKLPTAATPPAHKTMTPNSMSTKYTSDHRSYGCSQCHRVFRAEESLRQHYKASHRKWSSGVLGQRCDICKKSFASRTARQDHQRTKKHYLPCSECKQTFGSESSLVKHFDTFHASQFRCCDCEQDFVSEHALDQHLNDKVHETIRCQLCDQDLFSKSALDQHIVVEHHASVNPKRVFCLGDVHGCYICQRTFEKKKHSKRRWIWISI